ncbi:taf-13 [Pristionchus pacificus]|uniref:Transcription initiation factor TFIID subunit 13 n=1 Tax=Pristionchus pacificus TaxID=54126 RepID=A0A2A6CWR0_PRIPA|nr:taf-13 [Pristionchus pacificus]|eukprot:PDM82599.1 taf-13 [Pristionchus pacificus]
MEDDDLFNDSDEEPTTSAGKKPVAATAAEKAAPEGKGVFRKELARMMYGFGDDKEPFDKTLEMLESIVLDYIKEMCERAKAVGKPDKIQLEDIHYLIRRDVKKFARVKDLLSMSEELKKARKQFEDASTEKLEKL